MIRLEPGEIGPTGSRMKLLLVEPSFDSFQTLIRRQLTQLLQMLEPGLLVELFLAIIAKPSRRATGRLPNLTVFTATMTPDHHTKRHGSILRRLRVQLCQLYPTSLIVVQPTQAIPYFLRPSKIKERCSFASVGEIFYNKRNHDSPIRSGFGTSGAKHYL